MRTRAVEFVAPQRVRIVEREINPRAGDTLVRTLYSGISSGTELLAYRGEIDPSLPLDETIGSLGGTFSYPFHYGYSCVGVVESSADLDPGTLVFALQPHQDVFVCEAANAVVVANLDARIATMFPLVETALQITLDAGEVVEEDVVVMGLGAVGMITALLLQRAGARVKGVDPSEIRRRIAGQLDIESCAPEVVHEAASHVPLVVEASGNPEALSTALPLLAHEGTALVASWYGTKPVTLPLGAEFHRRRLTIRSTQVSSIPARLAGRWTVARRRAHVVQLLQSLPLKVLATHEFQFDRVGEAFRALDAGDDAIMHVALSYEGA